MTRVIEADEAGRLLLPVEVLGNAKPYGRYTVETAGTKLILEAEVPAQNADDPTTTELTFEEWLVGWRELQARMSEVWHTDKSAAEIIAEMRR